MNTAVDAAKAVISDLTNKRDATLKDLADVEDRRASLSYDAHVKGGEAAKALAKANVERHGIVLRLEELEHAISRANERFADAERGARAEELQAKAEAAREIVEGRLLARGAAADSGFAMVREALAGIEDDLRELRRLGAPAPGDDLVDVNRRRAVDAALMGLGLKTSPVPPSGRHSFDELVRAWSASIMKWVEARSSASNSRQAA